MLFYVSQKAHCALELIKISLGFVRCCSRRREAEHGICENPLLLVRDDSMFGIADAFHQRRLIPPPPAPRPPPLPPFLCKLTEAIYTCTLSKINHARLNAATSGCFFSSLLLLLLRSGK